MDMNKKIIFSLLLCLNGIIALGQSYNTVIYEGLDKLVDSVLTYEQAEHFKEESELLLIFNEVNKLPCTSNVLFIMVESQDGKPVDKFNMTLTDFRGYYDYSSEHKNEKASIWIDESFNQIGNYKITIHKNRKIKETDATENFRIRSKGCNFIFKKMVILD